MYDQQEVANLVRYLIDEDWLSVRGLPAEQDGSSEEKPTFLFVSETRRWYRV